MRDAHLFALIALVVIVVGSVPSGIAATTREARAAQRTDVPLRPLQTGLDDWEATTGTSAPVAFRRIRKLGASFVRLPLRWDQVAPAGAAPPQSFDAANPNDPNYHWASIDREVEQCRSAGLEPLLDVVGAPEWAAPARRERAQDGPTRPNVAAFRAFVTAAATRYAGHTPGLPRVRYWQAWNEPNVSLDLMPQVVGARAVSPDVYRPLLNAFDSAVHSVDPSNVTIAGGLSPFTVRNAAVETVGPLRFLRLLLCISAGASPKPTCSASVHVDAIAVHPYTSGDAEHSALNPDDLSLGDLPKLAPLLNAAKRVGHLRSRRPLETWITEFSWDSKPIDPLGVPVELETRWVSEALYRAWSNGITHFTWFGLRDQPLKTSDFQNGLYYRAPTIAGDRIKPIAAAFRFPFVAYRAGADASVWGRTAMSTAGPVAIQVKEASGWRTAATLTANRFGIFAGAIRGISTGLLLRASARGFVSPPFSLVKPPDYPVDPFGKT